MTLAAVSLWFALSAGPSDAEAAARAVERAKVHVAASEFDKASAALAEAFALDRNPAYLYARAQVERFKGDCAKAIELYRAFLAEGPPREDRELAERHIEACGGRRREAPPPPPRLVAPPPPLAAHETDDVAEPTDPVSDPRPDRPWFVDPAGGVLVGTGLAGVAVGLGFYGRSLHLDRTADRSATQDEFAARVDRAIQFNRAGLVTLGVGSALVVAGAIRYALVAARGRRAQQEARRSSPFVIRF